MRPAPLHSRTEPGKKGLFLLLGGSLAATFFFAPFAEAYTWTDNNLTAAARIRKTHIVELVNNTYLAYAAKCPSMGGPVFTGELTDPATGIIVGTTPVRASHYIQIRDQINALCVQVNGANCVATNPAPGNVIRAAHFNTLRTALNNLETGPPCAVCGDGLLQSPPEECEPPGTMTCNDACLFPVCGNGAVEAPAEQCEPPGGGGCDAFCRSLPVCGNNVREAGEDCDPPNGVTCDAFCQSMAFCGDDVRDAGEICDGSDLNGQTCASQGAGSGTLACNGNCLGFNTSSCASGSCGDGSCSGGETGVTCPADCCSSWANGSCGAGGCTNQRQQTRSCSGGGSTSQCIVDAACASGSCGDGSCAGGETGVTCPADCCGSWANGSCGAGGCTNQRQQTRTCSGGGTTSQCVADGACSASCGDGSCTAGETGVTCPGDCCGSWANGACNAGGCTNQRQQTRSCTGGGTTSQCVADPACASGSCGDGSCAGGETGVTCPADCCGSWANGACGAGGCTNQRQQTRTCTGGGTTSQCVADAVCSASCGDGSCNGGETGVTCPGDCCTSWVNGSCNAGGCSNQRQQTRSCTGGGTTSQCVSDGACVVPVCGNGTREGTEQCDNGVSNGPCPGRPCSSTCQNQVCPVCGNGVRETGEQCDNGGNNGPCPGRTCTSTCQNQTCQVCGNGMVEWPEQCDNGPPLSNNGACPRTCNSACQNQGCPLTCPGGYSQGQVMGTFVDHRNNATVTETYRCNISGGNSSSGIDCCFSGCTAGVSCQTNSCVCDAGYTYSSATCGCVPSGPSCGNGICEAGETGNSAANPCCGDCPCNFSWVGTCQAVGICMPMGICSGGCVPNGSQGKNCTGAGQSCDGNCNCIST